MTYSPSGAARWVAVRARYAGHLARHKWRVLRVGVALGPHRWWAWMAWLARLLLHDWSQLRPSEFGAYAEYFYGDAARRPRVTEAFDGAWLRHQHRNAHHWQHWLLRQDSGKFPALLMPPVVVDEMVCDWVASQHASTLRAMVEQACAWYAAQSALLVLRPATRQRAEARLARLARLAGIGPVLPFPHRATGMMTPPGVYRHPVTREVLAS